MGKHVTPIWHIILIPSQLVSYFLKAVCLVEKQYHFYGPELETTIYNTRGTHACHP
jgi:hypothetical protein